MIKVFTMIFLVSILLYMKNVNNNQEHVAGDRRNRIKITILSDNYVCKEGTQAEWGFSCLIDGTEKTILFDTGTNPAVLVHNLEKCNVDLRKIELVFISHEHRDHTGGLQRIIEENKNVSVYGLKSFTRDFTTNIQNLGVNVISIEESVSICSEVYTTGEMGIEIKEHSLIIKSDSGLVVITGCSHPGIIEILKKTKNILKEDIYFVFGGFHLLNRSMSHIEEVIKQIKDLKVRKVGPSHCTGDVAIEMFRNAFVSDFIQIGTGFVIEL